MSVYSSTDFNGSIVTRPNGDVSIEPSSVDLHLDSEFGWFGKKQRPVHVSDERTYPEFVKQEAKGTIEISPGEFLLANTEETVAIPKNAVGFLHGRSSVGRLGLFVHNAGLVDPSFAGTLTLELFNASRNAITLDVGMRICQMTVHELNSIPKTDYSEHNGNKYQNQRGPTPSRLYED